MNAREALIEKGALAVAGQTAWTDDDIRPITTLGPETHQSAMRAIATEVVDAVIPQITTIPELKALSGDALVVSEWGGCSSAQNWAARQMIMNRPLTVVWQPEAGDQS